jgi:hypothetical protein
VSSVVVQGRTLTFPVRVRRASMWSAQFLVPASRAQELVPKGLDVITVFGRALLALAFVRYDEGDLDAYHEFSTAIAVRRHDAPARGRSDLVRGRMSVYPVHMPVDQSFTLDAGRSIWGYPKWLATIDLAARGARTVCTVSDGGTQTLSLSIADGGPLRIPSRDVPTYSDAEGALNLTSWRLEGRVKGRFGGARIALGTGPIADTLRSLGLPKKAVLCTTARDIRAAFDAPTPVSL